MTTVHIGRLVLDGWTGDARSAEAVRAAVVAELTRLFSAPGAGDAVPGSGGAVPRADGGSVAWAGGDPTELGAAIGQAVYGGIGS